MPQRYPCRYVRSLPPTTAVTAWLSLLMTCVVRNRGQSQTLQYSTKKFKYNSEVIVYNICNTISIYYLIYYIEYIPVLRLEFVVVQLVAVNTSIALNTLSHNSRERCTHYTGWHRKHCLYHHRSSLRHRRPLALCVQL